MKHLHLLTLLAALAFAGCDKDDSSSMQPVTSDFDPAFARILQEKGYIPDAENITTVDTDNLAAITELDVSGDYGDPGPLTSLRGIEHFKSLTTLYCKNNQLTELDVSQNTKLMYMRCYSNELTELELPQNSGLIELNCGANRLTKLDVSHHTGLGWLECSSNDLTELDVSANTELTELWCSSNQLLELDVSQNPNLISLECGDNPLTELDVRQNPDLTRLECGDNQLTKLDISRNTGLMYLYCSFNELTELDISRNTALMYLSCGDNPGDGISTFPITAWFDNATIPDNLGFPKKEWQYGDRLITIDFRKAE